jgi:zinc D-Ala-D-Ala dipeptidase
MKKNLFLSVLLITCFSTLSAISDEARSKGFVDLHEIDPTILISLRYCTCENFVGAYVEGYKKPIVLITKQTAEALSKVQAEVKRDGYCLVIYDAYRPQEAVNHFVRWSENSSDQAKKAHYYPRVDKAKVFELGYVAKRSGHSRGSTVDLTLIKVADSLHAIEEKERVLLDGYTIKLLDDGTVDMGSSFDLFDIASHYENSLINETYKASRTYLKTVMEKYGFKNYAEEWWHFTLRDEPFAANQDSSYFNFAIE